VATRVVVIDQSMAQRNWPNDNPIGKHLTYSRENITVEIVGVVGSVKFSSLDGAARDEMYVPYTQRPSPNMTLVVRAASDPAALATAVRAQVQAVDKEQPVANVLTMEEVVANSIAQSRLTMLLLGIFAVAAMALAAVGIHGVMSYSVAQRTHEIGIRMALGAERGDVLRLVVGQGMVLALAGAALGCLGAFGLTRLMTSLLYDIHPYDFPTFLAVTTVLSIVALAANAIPARRATNIDPMIALRHE
jgi:putative ABC transport system permease protein